MAKERTDNKRLVIYLAQQGGGKTAVCDQLVSRYKAIKINVTPSWKRGPFPAYADICRHLGDGGPWKSTKAAENAMFRALNNRAPGILALDEGDSLGGESLNVLKFILNDTRWVIALFTLPALWDQMRKRTWLYSDQITRRALAIIDLDERLIRPGDVAPFMDRFKFNGEAGQIYKLVAEAANDWGAFDMVETIAANLDLIRNGTIPFKDKAAIPQVLHATAIARKNWRLHRYPPRKKAML